ncbi:MAG TPA: Type 1 glutamine amidotransferase-like domain-containing protein [Mucilaginibacter sp.]|nr:Type 1 glutamine amidotransferase-like domain-containing protein [Mucilaginibacter sp.]
MKFYLSSYKFGNEVEKLRQMLPKGSKIGHINNSRDFTWADPEIRESYQQKEIDELNGLGFSAEPLDLKIYFNKEDLLREKIGKLDGLWVSGGNTFVLRQAMKLSGFDNIFGELRARRNFLYAGYSAGICILCDSLKYIQNVDDPNDFPYPENKETIWDGLGVFNCGLLPHYDSDHFESAAVGKEVQACIDNKWLFKVLRDGEVIIIEEE